MYSADERTELDELRHLFSMQQERMQVTTKRWQSATGRKNVMPDLGALLDWLMKERDEARKTAIQDAARWMNKQTCAWTVTQFLKEMDDPYPGLMDDWNKRVSPVESPDLIGWIIEEFHLPYDADELRRLFTSAKKQGAKP